MRRYRCHISTPTPKSIEIVPITSVTAKVYNRWLSTFTNQFRWSAAVFLPRTRLSKGRGEGPKYLVEGPRSSPKHFRGRFFARTYLLRPVRVLIAQSIRARALNGAKKKSLNGDLFLLFLYLFSFLSFFSCSFLFEPSPLASENRRSDDRSSNPANQCGIAAFATRKSSRQRRRETLNIAFSSLNLPLRKIEFSSSCPFSTYSWQSWLVLLF